jgi:hypothetical protein
MKSDRIFHYTRSEKNISFSYYAARKYLYLFIPDPLLNILINLQFKADRFTAGSTFITESVVIQFARDLNFRMRRAEKKVRNILLNRIEDSSSLKNILHLLLYTVRRGVELFAEMANFFLYLLIFALSADCIRRII